jgi:hypothetical protein
LPEEFKSIFNEEDEPKLQLIIQSEHEKNNKQVHRRLLINRNHVFPIFYIVICTQIHHDLITLKTNDEIHFYSLLAEIPTAKRTPFMFFIYNRDLLGTHRASPWYLPVVYQKIITPSFPALPKPV